MAHLKIIKQSVLILFLSLVIPTGLLAQSAETNARAVETDAAKTDATLRTLKTVNTDAARTDATLRTLKTVNTDAARTDATLRTLKTVNTDAARTDATLRTLKTVNTDAAKTDAIDARRKILTVTESDNKDIYIMEAVKTGIKGKLATGLKVDGLIRSFDLPCTEEAAREKYPDRDPKQYIACCETFKTNQLTSLVKTKLETATRNTDDFNLSATDLIDCCMEGKIDAGIDLNSDAYLQARRICACHDDFINTPACFPCMSRKHHLEKADECLPIDFEYDDATQTAAVIDCDTYEPAGKYSLKGALTTIDNFKTNCANDGGIYNDATKECCRKSQTIPLCPCPNPQNLGTVYCGGYSDSVNSDVIRLERTERRMVQPRLWNLFQCLTPEIYEAMKNSGVNITEDYTLTKEMTETACEAVKQIVAGTYTPPEEMETRLISQSLIQDSTAGETALPKSLVSDIKIKTAYSAREPLPLVDCEIKFAACQCEDTPDTPDTPDKPPATVTTQEQPPPQPSPGQICMGFAGGTVAICSDTPDIVYTDTNIGGDNWKKTTPVFPSEVGGEANFAYYKTLMELINDWEQGKETLDNVRAAMKEPALNLVQAFADKTTSNTGGTPAQLAIKAMVIPDQAAPTESQATGTEEAAVPEATGGSTATLLETLTPEHIAFEDDVGGGKRVRIKGPIEIEMEVIAASGPPTFAQALSVQAEQVAMQPDTIISLAFVGVGGGAGGCTLVRGNTDPAILLLFMVASLGLLSRRAYAYARKRRK